MLRPPTPKFVYFSGLDTYNFAHNFTNIWYMEVIIGVCKDCGVDNKM